MTLERKVRYITEKVALEELIDAGYGHIRPFKRVAGGLLGDALFSKLYHADGYVWEWEEKEDDTRVYLYTEEELKEHGIRL